MNKENKAIKEIAESVILTEYLLAHDLDFNDIKNFTSRSLKKALEWKRGIDEP